jgi:hypothetical protein
VERYGRAGQFTDDNIIQHMSFAFLIPKATNTFLEYVIFFSIETVPT